jgi:hypothetical protein
MREHCEITPDSSISETLTELHLNPRDSHVGCFCCCCRNYASIIAGPGTIDSSDSVFAESNTWSDESDIQVDDIQVESPELIRQNTFNDSDSLFSNDSGDTDLPNALCSDSQYFYNDSESTGHDLSQKVFCLINSGDSTWISSTCMSDSSDQVLLLANTESDESIVPGPAIILA